MDYESLLLKIRTDRKSGSFNSDRSLQLISDFLSEKPDLSPDKLQVTSENGKRIELATTNGIVINDLLPSGYSISFSENGFCVDGNELKVPRNIETLGQYGLLALSHEIGHTLDPENNIDKKISNEARIESTQAETFEARITALTKMMNYLLKTECSAWDYGKTIADLLGVDMVIYEDLMDYAMKWYLMDQLEYIAIEDEGIPDSEKDFNLTIIDPVSRDELTLPYTKLMEFIRQSPDYDNFKVKYIHTMESAKIQLSI